MIGAVLERAVVAVMGRPRGFALLALVLMAAGGFGATRIPLDKITLALNSRLPEDVEALAVEAHGGHSGDFHVFLAHGHLALSSVAALPAGAASVLTSIGVLAYR